MQDQHFTKEWSDGHSRFSTDFDRGLGHIAAHLTRRQRNRLSIGATYALLDRLDAQRPAKPVLSPAAQASLRGLAASVITFALWITVMVAATPAPGLAAPFGVTLA